MPEEKTFSFTTVLILLVIFLAVFITITFILTPDISEGWVTMIISFLITPP